MTTTLTTAPDYARFGRAAVSRDPTRTLFAKPLDLRLESPFRAGPLSAYDFCACDGHRLHAWRADRFAPEEARPFDAGPDEPRAPDFWQLPCREGRRFSLFRLPLRALLPGRLPPRQKHPTHGVLFHAAPGDGLRFFRCQWGSRGDDLGWFTDEGELPEVGSLVNAALVLDVLAGMPEEFTLYLPEDPLAAVTFEGDGALALLMPMKR